MPARLPLAGGLAVVAGNAQRLQVAPVEAVTTRLDRLDVIDRPCRNNQTPRLTRNAQRVCPQERRSCTLPRQ